MGSRIEHFKFIRIIYRCFHHKTVGNHTIYYKKKLLFKIVNLFLFFYIFTKYKG